MTRTITNSHERRHFIQVINIMAGLGYLDFAFINRLHSNVDNLELYKLIDIWEDNYLTGRRDHFEILQEIFETLEYEG